MPSSLAAFVLPAILAAIASLLVAGAVRFAMLRRGIVVAPRADRWHRVPTPTYGGVGILAGLLVAVLAFGAIVAGTAPIIGCCVALFMVGLYDDWNPLSALAKMVASLAVAAFFVMTLTGSFPGPLEAVVIVAAIVGFGGLDNAVNLLDNMDGLAATVCATAAIGLAVTFRAEFEREQLVVLASLTGALLGFLWWNRHPARQFMGNCGSLAVGGVLAACATVAIVRSGTLESIVSAALVLVVPILDSTFVVLLRRLAGRSTTRGNIDHTSHRLVSAGFSDVAAVLSLNVLGAIGATVGYVLHHHVGPAWLLTAIFAVAVCLLALAIARIPAYAGEDFRALQDARFAPLLNDLTFRWHAGEVLLDVALITICYYAGYRIRFEGEALSAFLGVFSRSLPAIIGCQLAGLYLSGLYGRMWRTFGLPDLWTVIRAVGIGLILSVLTVTYVYKFETFSRSVFLFDGALLIAAIVVSRMSLRVFSHLAANVDSQRRRTAIYGAGTRGQLLAREFSVDPAWGRIAVAFIDDDVWKIGRRFVGVPVRGGIDDLEAILRDKRIEEVLISTGRIGPEAEQRLRAHCARADIQVRRLHLEIT